MFLRGGVLRSWRCVALGDAKGAAGHGERCGEAAWLLRIHRSVRAGPCIGARRPRTERRHASSESKRVRVSPREPLRTPGSRVVGVDALGVRARDAGVPVRGGRAKSRVSAPAQASASASLRV